jgi:putative membrane protein insertion efficiency factor
MERICQRFALAILKGYKLLVSPMLAPSCRFTPTCSEYASDAIEQYGAVRGVMKALKRLLRCHPFHRGGWDPA